jgi:hypothetical protein
MGSVRQKLKGNYDSHHSREDQQGRYGPWGHRLGRTTRCRWRGSSVTRPLRPNDVVVCRCNVNFRFWRRARASHLAIITTVDLANRHHFRLGFAHPIEPGSIVRQDLLRVRRKVIEAAKLGHHEPCGKIRFGLGAGFSGDPCARARSHGCPVDLSAQSRRRSWRSLDGALGYLI